MFEVIRGGLSDKVTTSKKEFLSAYVTDTRLMGVVAMYVHWYLPENTRRKNLHQFFYFDAEEFGFDTYNRLIGDDSPETYLQVQLMENEMIGGLGGSKIAITEEEACSLLQDYVAFNLKAGIPLPEKEEEYFFMMTPQVRLDEEGEGILMCKQCTVINTPYQLINYFIMRCVGRDFPAAKFLTKHYVRTDLFPEHKAATLLKNTVDEATDAESGTNSDYYITDDDKEFGTFATRKAYMCESLIEYDGKFFILITQVTLDRLKVVKYEKISSFRISPEEASMMISRPEYITLFEATDRDIEISPTTTRLLRRAMASEHATGQLFMIFFPHNNHVDQPVYHLHSDVMGVYYFLHDGHVLLAAYSEEDISRLEKDLMDSPLAESVVALEKYQFLEPVLNQFIDSEIPDFEEFVDMIGETEDEDS